MKNKLKYPVQMECIQDGLVVEFISESIGTVVKIGNNRHFEIGDFNYYWIRATNSDVWRVYNPPSLSHPADPISEETAKQLGDLMAKELLHMNNTYYEKELNDYAKLLANRLIVSPPITPAHEKALKTIDILTERIRVLSGMLTEYMTKEVLDNNNKKEIEAGARLNTQYMVDLVNCRSASTVPPLKSDTEKPIYRYVSLEIQRKGYGIMCDVVNCATGNIIYTGNECNCRAYVRNYSDAT